MSSGAVTSSADVPPVSEHYARADLEQEILAALRTAGKDLHRLTSDDLAPATEFHVGGKEATVALAQLAGLCPETRVLDVGGGLGGPARTLASEFGCQVTVLDLTEEYCRVGERLTARTGLSDRVTFRHGNALTTPFGDGAFDAVWTQHSTMNVADKEQLYREIRRVLRPGGTLAFQEVMAGALSPIYFPVPWARTPQLSFLVEPSAARAQLAAMGFEEKAWLDVSAAALEGYRQRLAAGSAASLPPLGLHLLLGDDFGEMTRNQIRNLEENRIVLVRGVFARP
jgi:ubiquinone/menaquinone biosynthesis C-methylase UbiE